MAAGPDAEIMGDGATTSTDSPSGRRPDGIDWGQYAKSGALLLVAAGSLYVLLPTLLSVFGSWRSLLHLEWPFAFLVFICEGGSYVCLWELDRIVLATRTWFAIACAQLSGNAVGRIVPGAPTPFTVEMLSKAGVDTGKAVAALSTSTGLQLATTAALPLLALPALFGGMGVSRGLANAAYLGFGVLVLLVAAGAAVLASDAPLQLIARVVQWLLNHTVRRGHPVDDASREVLADRDFIRTRLGERWRGALLSAAANTGFDYLALLSALWAVGATPRPALVVLAYTAAELLALLPFTPGGLGFVEAGLVGTLVVAGVPGPDALAATLLYRLASYWLPIPAGGVAYVLFRRRYG